ncbi:MAG: RloB family protein [Spirochaetota bacterium]
MSRVKKLVAIVGEGKTEWHYFDSMKNHKRFPFKIKPELPCNSNWRGVLRRARNLIKEHYDEVYCVLDYDEIISDTSELRKFESEIRKLKSKKSTQNIQFILSMPCIEYWFLLHFKKTVSSREYVSYSELKPELLQHIPDYEKTEKYFRMCDFYKMMSKDNKEEHAISLAKEIKKLRERSDSFTFPFTDVYLLIEELEKIGKNFRNR